MYLVDNVLLKIKYRGTIPDLTNFLLLCLYCRQHVILAEPNTEVSALTHSNMTFFEMLNSRHVIQQRHQRCHESEIKVFDRSNNRDDQTRTSCHHVSSDYKELQILIRLLS